MDVWEKVSNGKRLIDGVELRSRIIAFATGIHSEVLPVDTVMMLLMQTPTVDAVEVVRCRECKHLMFSDCYGECGKGHMGVVRPDDFCSRGERKEGADRLEETNG